jgi:ankyrin repeat protein
VTSEALQALYEGELDRARELLPRDEDLSVFEAAAFGRIDRLAAILDDDPSQASAFSLDGFTALHLAVFAEELEAARLLIERGADVSVRSTSEVARVPPLGTAAFVRSASLAALLLGGGADVDGQGEGGFTALHTAAANGDEPLVRLLLEHGADPTIPNAAGKRPVELARDATIRALLAS